MCIHNIEHEWSYIYLIVYFSVRFGDKSGEFTRAMVLTRRTLSSIPLARPNEQIMPPKRAKKPHQTCASISQDNNNSECGYGKTRKQNVELCSFKWSQNLLIETAINIHVVDYSDLQNSVLWLKSFKTELNYTRIYYHFYSSR